MALLFQISALKERLTSLSSENGAMHIASPDRHKALVQEELDRLHQQVNIYCCYVVAEIIAVVLFKVLIAIFV